MKIIRKTIFLLALVPAFLFQPCLAQKSDSAITRNVALMVSVSMLDGNGLRFSLPAFYYGSRKHAFAMAPALNFTSDNSSYGGLSISYYYFLEPSFRDITFYLVYNAGYFFRDNSPLTHIVGIGTQLDIGKRGFIQHSVGFGFHQNSSDFSLLGPAGQLKLSLGIYLREIPVVHIHEDWENQGH